MNFAKKYGAPGQLVLIAAIGLASYLIFVSCTNNRSTRRDASKLVPLNLSSFVGTVYRHDGLIYVPTPEFRIVELDMDGLTSKVITTEPVIKLVPRFPGSQTTVTDGRIFLLMRNGIVSYVDRDHPESEWTSIGPIRPGGRLFKRQSVDGTLLLRTSKSSEPIYYAFRDGDDRLLEVSREWDVHLWQEDEIVFLRGGALLTKNLDSNILIERAQVPIGHMIAYVGNPFILTSDGSDALLFLGETGEGIPVPAPWGNRVHMNSSDGHLWYLSDDKHTIVCYDSEGNRLIQEKLPAEAGRIISHGDRCVVLISVEKDDGSQIDKLWLYSARQGESGKELLSTSGWIAIVAMSEEQVIVTSGEGELFGVSISGGK